MKPFQIAAGVAAAGLFLAGCAALSPDSVKYQVSQAGSGNQYALACVESSSGNCHVQIDGAEGKAGRVTVPVGSTRPLPHAVPGASFCVSSSEAGGLTCAAMRAVFGPAGSVVTRH